MIKKNGVNNLDNIYDANLLDRGREKRKIFQIRSKQHDYHIHPMDNSIRMRIV